MSTLNKSLIAAKKTFPPILREKQGQTGNQKYMYAPLDVIYDAVNAPLSDAGLTLSTYMDGGNITTSLLHESGESRDSTTPIGTLADWNNNAKEYGKAMTYLTRYMIIGLLGISPETDTDGPGAGAARQQQQTNNTSQRRNAMEAFPDECPDQWVGTLRRIESLGDKKIASARLLAWFSTPDGREVSVPLFKGEPLDFIATAFQVEIGKYAQWEKRMSARKTPVNLEKLPFETELLKVEKNGKTYININIARQDSFNLRQKLVSSRLAQRFSIESHEWPEALGVQDPAEWEGTLEEAHTLLMVYSNEREEAANASN